MHTTLVLFARLPVPGRVKTRLAAAIGAEGACELYTAFLSDLVQRFQRSCDRRIIAYTPDSTAGAQFFESLAAGGFTLWPQPEGDLGRRLARCFEIHLEGSDSVMVIGSDAPTLPAELIEQATASLAESDCVLGPATDGGYYLVGLRRPCPELFSGIEWGGTSVLKLTAERAQAAGLRLHLLPPWYDVDTQDDLMALRGHLAAWRAAGIDPGTPRTERLLADAAGAGDG